MCCGGRCGMCAALCAQTVEPFSRMSVLRLLVHIPVTIAASGHRKMVSTDAVGLWMLA